MSARRFSATVRAALLLAAVAGHACAQAESNPAYWHETTAAASRTDWLAAVPGSTKLRDLSLPGTHDTVTGQYTGRVPDVQTQTLPVAVQLAAGIRVMDIRCRQVDDAFVINHGPIALGWTFDDVLHTVIGFLQQHPGEMLLMRVKEESKPSGSNESFDQTFARYFHDPAYAQWFWQPNGADPTLDQVRSRIVVLQDFGAADGTVYGLDYGSFDIQDDYVVKNREALYAKWTEVKAQLAAANASVAGSRPFFMNYLSGSTWASPYFVASGKQSPGTDDPLRLTGRKTPLSKSFDPDFPRIDCSGLTCDIAYDGTNPLAYGYITDPANAIAFTGIVMADYPGQGLIDALIALDGVDPATSQPMATKHAHPRVSSPR